jgi:hypothetical protein
MKVRTAQGYQPCIVAGLNSEVVVPRLTAVGQNQHLSLTQNDDVFGAQGLKCTEHVNH